jgi:CheY-like chemotaxis protein
MTTPATHRLLVIDDSSTIRKLVELSFRGAPFTLEFAVTGAEGIEKALLGPDAILLDCVLPDMKAADVCQRLTDDPRGRGARIVLMSAKEREAVKSLFDRFPQVIDFVGKPFSADEVLDRIKAVVARVPARDRGSVEGVAAGPAAGAPGGTASAPVTAPGPTVHGLGPKETEAAAKALYARLARPLASVPEWVRQASGAPTAPASVPAFLARKLLTPELVASLLDALRPFYAHATPPEPTAAAHGGAVAAPVADPDEGAPLRGQIAGWSLPDLLSFVGSAGRTGDLILRHRAERLLLHFDSGEIVLATSHDPIAYLRDSHVDLTAVPGEARARADAEQRTTGTPLYVTLAEAGALRSQNLDLAEILHERGVSLLRHARETSPLAYAWHDRAALPLHAVTWGRHISIPEDLTASAGGGTARSIEPTLAQLTLERLRRPSAWAEADERLPSQEQCHDRAAGFSQKLRSLSLTASEQRVLSLVDRTNSLRALVQRSGLPTREVARILYRLSEIELVTAVPLAPSVSSAPSAISGISSAPPSSHEPATRPVMILDPDDEGFCRPLREMLARRPRPVPLLDLSGELDVADAISRERPGLVVLNEATAGGKLLDIARAVRAAPHLSGTALAAVLEGEGTASPDALHAAGFDAVWTKPVHYLDLVSLLAVEPAQTSAAFSHHIPPSRT